MSPTAPSSTSGLVRTLFRVVVIAGGLAVTAAILNARLGAGEWEIVALEGTGIPSVDGRPIPHADHLARRIRPGARLRVPRGLRLEIRSRGALAVEIESGTDATVPRRPGRWWGRRVSCELEGGAIRVATEKGFAGAALIVITPAARVELGMGAAAVAVEPRGTRVGVLEGSARAAPPGALPVTVSPGAEVFLFNAAIEASNAPLGAEDREALERLRSQSRR